MFDHRGWPAVRTVIRSAVVILVSAAAAPAQDAHWSPFWDELAARSDAKVIDGVSDKGEPTRRIELSSGVSFDLERHADQITSMGSDHTGLGAVQCSWEIYVAVRAYVEACVPGEDRTFEVDLDDAIKRMNDFIVENSLVPVTKSQLQDAVEQRKRQVGDAVRGQSNGDHTKQCEADAVRPISLALRSMSHDARVSNLNRLLSVKRPPVMNPCL
ncbi:conserved hypothetical protein [Bradyrhizobium sp. STM 3843]|uniref:hypothetical protein n=1 Tax=Bradyrhizobium sp. STM 3843 TaxID=551947 RepID=UPI00024036DE|nr:hypothetical protein [Bradyrhizobium sp. STM 3843]CCE09606.1 conserved hypothetical protein [Bradyrhizobium sp. STM 3843]